MFRTVFFICFALFVSTIQSVSAQNTKSVYGTKFQDCPDCPKMIVVRGDTFTMGSLKSEKDSRDRERPRHKVRIKTFAVGRYEVTRSQFQAFMIETGYSIGNKCWTIENSKKFFNFFENRSNRNYLNPGFSQGYDHPVVCVNWDDAKAYVAWLSRKTGKQYRLLTEAEWEYVASAKHTTFWWGNSISTDQANYDGKFKSRGGVYRKRTVAVDSFSPNPFGLYNMHGNVQEWVEDCYHKNYRGAPTDGSAWLNENSGICNDRILRGGSWFDGSQDLRARNRVWANRGYRTNFVGFRVAISKAPCDTKGYTLKHIFCAQRRKPNPTDLYRHCRSFCDTLRIDPVRWNECLLNHCSAYDVYFQGLH